MWSTFEKNIYTIQETAKAMIHVDNHECTLRVTSVNFWITQNVHINLGDPF